MIKYSIFIVSFALLFISCSTTYKISYDTYLKDSPNKELKFSDDKFEFAFIPVANGIYFTIKNNSDRTAYLVWDKSYFIEPSGNTFKALDIDAINTVNEVARKENNESPIPAKSSFARFTTPNTNLQKFQEFNTVIVNNYFTNYTYSTTFKSDFFDVGAYWVTTLKKEDESSGVTYYSEESKIEDDDMFLDKNCKEIKNNILQNNKLGLGFYIKQDDKEYEYRFDFKVNQVNIYKVSDNKNILKRVMKESENFEIIKK